MSNFVCYVTKKFSNPMSRFSLSDTYIYMRIGKECAYFHLAPNKPAGWLTG